MTTLDLAVDRASEVPLGTQLIWRLRTAIASGELGPGDRVPGLREVAEAAGVNINTVRSVFARLEEQGLLTTEHGRGTFVASGIHVPAVLAEMAEAALAQAQEAGIDPRELAAALYVSRTTGRDERAERQALRAQIARLEREIGALDRLGSVSQEGNVGPLLTLAPDPASAAPRVLTTAELREARDTLVARLHELRREREEWRAEAQQRELEEVQAAEAEREARRARERPSRWREAGVWTGGPHTRVSWTAP